MSSSGNFQHSGANLKEPNTRGVWSCCRKKSNRTSPTRQGGSIVPPRHIKGPPSEIYIGGISYGAASRLHSDRGRSSRMSEPCALGQAFGTYYAWPLHATRLGLGMNDFFLVRVGVSKSGGCKYPRTDLWKAIICTVIAF